MGVFLCVGNVQKNIYKIVVDNTQHTPYSNTHQRGTQKANPDTKGNSMTDAEKYTEIIKKQGIKSVTVYLFHETEMIFKQVFNCEKDLEEFGMTADSVTMEKGCDTKYCPNGLPFECFEDTYKYLFVYEW